MSESQINDFQLVKLLRQHVIDDLARLILSYMDVEVIFLRQWYRGSKEWPGISDGMVVLSPPGEEMALIITDRQGDQVQMFTAKGEGEEMVKESFVVHADWLLSLPREGWRLR